jgi:Ca2+-transporting ATPase
MERGVIRSRAKPTDLFARGSPRQTLGCTSTICCDKTGTLTTNQMSVCELVLPKLGAANGKFFPLAWRAMTVEGTSFDFTAGRVVSVLVLAG